MMYTRTQINYLINLPILSCFFSKAIMFYFMFDCDLQRDKGQKGSSGVSTPTINICQKKTGEKMSKRSCSNKLEEPNSKTFSPFFHPEAVFVYQYNTILRLLIKKPRQTFSLRNLILSAQVEYQYTHSSRCYQYLVWLESSPCSPSVTSTISTTRSKATTIVTSSVISSAARITTSHSSKATATSTTTTTSHTW